MKISACLAAAFCALSFSALSQHDHHETENLFSEKSFYDFKEAVGMTDSDFNNPSIVEYVDSQYQQFHVAIEQRLDQGEEIPLAVLNEQYDSLVKVVKRNKKEVNSGFQQPSVPKVLNGPCVNMDFEDGDLNGWELYLGNVDGSSPYSFAAQVPTTPGAYHQICNGGNDPVTGIPMVDPMGGNFSVRLGNGTGTGAVAAKMSQTFLVDANNYMFTYSYAVVFQSPGGHGLNQLPYFTVRVFDELGNNVPCGDYTAIANAANAPEYSTTNWGGSTVLYKDWTTVFTNLSAYIGQNVTIEFTAGDCSLTGHFGYAYVDASCGMEDIVATQDTICTGDATTLTAPSGADSYLWSNGATTQSITVTSGGTYTCTLTPFQGAGCSISLDITIIENPEPTANFVSNTTTICEGESIEFTDMSTVPNPGVISLYQWDFGDGTVTPSSSGVISGIPNTSGTYLNPTHVYTVNGSYTVNLMVTTTDGCTDSYSINVLVNDLPVVLAGNDQAVCMGEQVTLNGAGAVNYSWSPNITDGVAFTPSVGTTTYTVTGTDANGCQNTDQVDVIVHPLPMVDAGTDVQVCDGSSITLSASGAVSYVWDNGVVDSSPFVQAVGTVVYTVTGTDANGCENTDQIDVTVNPLPIIDAGPDQTVCEDQQVTLTAVGAPSLVWDLGVSNSVPFYGIVGSTTYTVTGTDANGCVSTDQVTINVNALPDVIGGPDITVCDGEQVTLQATGASAYSWSGGISNGIPFIQPVGSQSYIVTGTDGNGCVNSDTVNVVVNPNPVVEAGENQSICEGELVTLNGEGSGNMYWNGGFQNGTPFVQPVGTVVYTLNDFYSTGCSAFDTVVVVVHPKPVVTAENKEICLGEGVTLQASGASSYDWSNGVVDGIEFFPTQTDFYTVIGTTIYGCADTATVEVKVHPLPQVDFDILNPSLTTVTSMTGFDNLSTGAVYYTWDFDDGSFSNEFEPTHTFPTDDPGTYEVVLTGETEYGCVSDKIKYVYVTQDYTIYVPNTFTPDANGVNEVFKPVMDGFDEDQYTLYIFNRWGDLVFESHNMDVGWDGSYAGKFEQVQDGVYTWKIEAGIKNSTDSKIFVGHVTVLK